MMLISLLSIFSVGLMAMSTGGSDSDEESTETAPEPITDEESPVVEDTTPRSVSALLSVTDSSGDELPDATVLTEGPVDGESADRDYIITAPAQGQSDIEVGYDPNTTFQVDLNPGVLSLEVGLNTDVVSSPAASAQITTETVAENGSSFEQTTETLLHNAATDITVTVDQAQIGTHVAQIDLSNPFDELHFEFGADVTGNLHLITNETELPVQAGSLTQSTLYVIQTAADVTSLTPGMIEQIIAQDGSAGAGTQLLAEIFLGEESVIVDGNEITVSDGMNAVPALSTNVSWTSEGIHDGTLPGEVPVITTPDVPAVIPDPVIPQVPDVPTTTPVVVPDTPTTVPDVPTTTPGGIVDLLDPDVTIPDLTDIPGLTPADLEALEGLTPAQIAELNDLLNPSDLGGIPDLGSIPDFGGIPTIPTYPGLIGF